MRHRVSICYASIAATSLFAIACGDAPPPSLGAVPAGAVSRVRGTSASDIWTTSCGTGSIVVIHYDGSSWRTLAPPHSGSCNDGTGNGAEVVPAGGGVAWFTSASALVRIGADGTMQDFTMEVAAAPGVTSRAIGAFGDTVFIDVPAASGLTSELYVLRNGHFVDAGMLTFRLMESVHMTSATSGFASALANDMPADPNMPYSHAAHWDGTTLTLPTVPYNSLWMRYDPTLNGVNASFRWNDLWMTNPDPGMYPDAQANLYLAHWDGTMWEPRTVPRPTGPNGEALAILTLVQTASHSLVAIGVVATGGYDLAHDPAGVMYGDAPFVGQAWDGTAWGGLRKLGTLQRCAGPNCSGETGAITDSVMTDGTIITGNGGGGDSNAYALRYE